MTFWALPLPQAAITPWWRLLHNPIGVAPKLFRWNPTSFPSPLCRFCTEVEDTFHFVVRCPTKWVFWSAGLTEMNSASCFKTSEDVWTALVTFQDTADNLQIDTTTMYQLGFIFLAVWKQHWRCAFDDIPWSLSAALALLQQSRHLVLPDLDMNNQINNGSSSTSNESVQRMVERSTAMHHSNDMVIAQSMVHRPVNTNKAYPAKQEKWKVWCRDQGFEDGYTVSDRKLSFFLMEYVSKRRSKYRRNNDGTPVALGRESILAYVKAISDMCNTQKALEWNTNGVSSGPLIRAFLNTLENEKVKRRRLNYEDRGKNTLNDGYSKEELKKVNSFFFTEKNDIRGCRNRLCFLLSHAMLCRSQTTLGMEFADLFSLEVENQGLTECIALVATIAHGKTKQHGKIEYGSSLRHRDVEVCSIGALALYLFSRFHFEKRENWYKTGVFKGDSPFKFNQYKAQNSTYVDVFKKVGIHTSKVTHANRKSALNMIAQENSLAISKECLPVEAMKSLAGFNGQQHSNYFLPRAVIIPSLPFQKLEYIASPNFLNLFAHLRVVLLQQLETWDLNLMTTYIQRTMLDSKNLSLSDLQQKTLLLLLCTATMGRSSSDIARLQHRDIHWEVQDTTATGVTIHFREPKETQLRGSLPEDHTLLLAYISKPSEVKSVRPKTVASWLKNHMAKAGIDTSIYTAHSFRSASSTKAVQQGILFKV
ncbi:hypothetical protein G6F44_010014 [Rhizopus delemar]|nr:hypothetical protein G6F44_010014 [Rhizopus delemar]